MLLELQDSANAISWHNSHTEEVAGCTQPPNELTKQQVIDLKLVELHNDALGDSSPFVINEVVIDKDGDLVVCVESQEGTGDTFKWLLLVRAV